MDKMVTDDWEQFTHFVSGRYDLPDTHTELSEVVAGKKRDTSTTKSESLTSTLVWQFMILSWLAGCSS